MVKFVNGFIDVLMIVISRLISKGVKGLCGILLLSFVNVRISFIRIVVIIILIVKVCIKLI